MKPMRIFTKYKKHFDQGFKDFVMNLDLLPQKVAKEIIANALLEDPVYTKWAIENKLNFDYFIKLEKLDVQKVLRAFANPHEILLRSLKGHPLETRFITSHLPSFMLKQYLSEREVLKITVAHQDDARIKIMQTIFNLKESGELEPFDWKLPPSEVMLGTSHVLDKLGNYKQFYENNILAITGTMDKGKRSGLWKNFYPNGAIHAEGNYFQGEKVEEWSLYYLNGKLKSVGSYKHDLKNGEWKEFEPDSTFKVQNYINGRIA